MDTHTLAPATGASGAPRSAPRAENPKEIFAPGTAPPAHGASAFVWPTQKEAYSLFEFFSPGTRTDVILLGEPIEVEVHHVKSKRFKILCTASTGVCEACQVCGTSLDVSHQQTEYHAPALRKAKDRRYHQCVAVFTAKQYKDQVEPLLQEEGARGMRLDVHRTSSQKAEIKAVKGSAQSRSASLPASFELLPWVRARWGLPQQITHPTVRLEPVTLREIDRGPVRAVKSLALTADDRVSATELEAVKAKMAEARARFSGSPAPVAPAPAPVPPPAPVVSAPVPPPAPVVSAPPAPVAPAPAPVPPPAPVVSAPVPPPAPVRAPTPPVVSAPAPVPPPAPVVPVPPPPPAPIAPLAPRARTVEEIAAALDALEADHPTEPSSGMVPAPGRAIAAQRPYIRQRLAEGYAEEERQRRALKKLARDGHDLGNDRVTSAAGALDAVITAVANGRSL